MESIFKNNKKYPPLLMSEHELPEDLKEIIEVVKKGQLPSIQGFMKYDFTSESYLRRCREYVFNTIGSILLLIFAVIYFPVAIIILTWIGISIGTSFVALKNFKLYKEAKLGNTYLLFTPKYLVFREGRYFQVFKWKAIEHICVIRGGSQNNRVATQFQYNECPHLAIKQNWLLDRLRAIISASFAVFFQLGWPIEKPWFWLSKHGLLANNDRYVRLRLSHLKGSSIQFVEQAIVNYKNLYG
jgi:hypothetical protein